ncbi:hypothetical protein ACWC0A_33400 [Streptomyces scopuliridis]
MQGPPSAAASWGPPSHRPERYGPEPRFLRRAEEAGIALRPLADHGTARPADGHVRLVIGYARLTPGGIERGVRLPAEAAAGGQRAAGCSPGVRAPAAAGR